MPMKQTCQIQYPDNHQKHSVFKNVKTSTDGMTVGKVKDAALMATTSKTEVATSTTQDSHIN